MQKSCSAYEMSTGLNFGKNDLDGNISNSCYGNSRD